MSHSATASTSLSLHIGTDVTPEVREQHAAVADPGQTDRLRTLARDRKRAQRARNSGGEVRSHREDWQLFTDLADLPQKAGCHPHQLRSVVLKELVDNALDAGAKVWFDRIKGEGGLTGWRVCDDGPGVDPGRVPELFNLRRGLTSSKLIRRTTRGALGNGLRVVLGAATASGGSLAVETQGQRLDLNVDLETGDTLVETSEVPLAPGTVVEVLLGPSLPPWISDETRAETAIRTSTSSRSGPVSSSPHWYTPTSFHNLLKAAMPGDTVGDIASNGFGVDLDDIRPARSLGLADAVIVLSELKGLTRPVSAKELGPLGQEAIPSMGYAMQTGQVDSVPYIIEVWASCHKAEAAEADVRVNVLLNRTPALARLQGYWRGKPKCIMLSGCGLNYRADGPAAGDYGLTIGLITPYCQKLNDGKEPDLKPFADAILTAVSKAAKQAHKAANFGTGMRTKDAAYEVMAEAYRRASDNGQLPATARQVMYQARGDILSLTGKETLDDVAFTQRYLPDYQNDYPGECADWDVVYDARGNLIEPHTDRAVALGTLQVREYLGERPPLRSPIELAGGRLYRTSGPRHRYQAILFIEKEGFLPLLTKMRIAERYDIALMSTKGMSNTAARRLLDGLADHVEQVLVLHDFDVAGFSIFGTLATDSRRYQFANEVPVVDISPRLDDIQDMDLAAEPVPEDKGSWGRRFTLPHHGATPDEIEFLLDKRVELNAMTSRQFIGFVERKLEEQGVEKVVPDQDVLAGHARTVLNRALAERELAAMRDRLEAQAHAIELPPDLESRVQEMLVNEPDIPWDEAVARVARELIG